MASPFFFVKKKDGKLCPVQDYRKLNKMMIKNHYPLLLISELMDKLRSAKYFTKLDIRWGYNNVCIKKDDEWKAMFRTNHGLFKPTVMFFGLTNSPTMFQWMMNDIFKDLIATGKVTIYLDDILIFSKTLEEHWKITHCVLELLRKHKLFLKAEKCKFEVLETKYLRVIITRWVTELAEYHFTLHHKPSTTNKKVDLLSRRADHLQGQDDNDKITILAPKHFQALIMPTTNKTHEHIKSATRDHQKWDQGIANSLNHEKGLKEENGLLYYDKRIYVPRDSAVRGEVISHCHDHITAGHPGIEKMKELILRNY
ncbi:uncharacterized protein ARMOST_11780 [Armillaria ostoyae]|uniref:Reverse transcriptase domain-containing protein n=1 Tax=Armillaria ostoyae TaxID=47428 RepID=A0A284RI71_ARMOS|nr:uncharacterized protein ARMOST_11780 [Armillaria ostoyae]